jgi:imidazolonepropionase-like amidohydrolase/Tol biopolymer transport system component
MKKFQTVIFFLFLSSISFSQDEQKWDVNDPPGNYVEHNIELDEGTWMNLDVSPDGKEIVFDLLGDIYKMPSAGGDAILLRGGLAYEVQPKFSPDGAKILFTSDAGGGDNIWIMDADGSDAKQVTKESFRLLNNASWSPDGTYFVARKHFTSERSLGAGEIWMYHIDGGSGFQLTKRRNDQQDVNEPSFSKDGRYIYYSEDMYPGGYFQYNKNPNSQIYVIKQYDRTTGDIKTLISGPGGAIRPVVSRDGTKLAYIRRVRTESVLFIYDFKTGSHTPITNMLSKDQQEAWAIFGAYTHFNWTPNDESIIFWGKGKIWSVDVTTKELQEIPFKVNAKHRIQETVKFTNPVFIEDVELKVLRNLRTSPREDKAIFTGAGYLYEYDFKSEQSNRLSETEAFEFEASYNSTGTMICYVSWEDETQGHVWIKDLNTGALNKLTTQAGIYRTPTFSADNSKVVFRKDGGNSHQGYTNNLNPGIYYADLTSREIHFVHTAGEYPVFSADDTRIFYQTGGFLFGSLTKALHSVKLDGTDVRKHVDSKYAQRFSISPDNKWIAWSELYKVYVAALPMTGQSVLLTSNSTTHPVKLLAKDEGINIHWSPNSEVLHWTMGNSYFSSSVGVSVVEPSEVKVKVLEKADKPSGYTAFTNGRIITMKGEELIENGTVLVKDNVITAVGPSSSIDIPRSATLIDLKGKTLLPGLIDVHGHLGNFRYGLSPQQQWEYYANLAYGVTTAHDPSSNSEMIFSQSEMIKLGRMVGPRLYSTGTILYGAEGDFKAVINSLDDARSALRRTKAYGAFSVKSYNQPRREQRQQVLQAARELGMLVVPEGGSFFYHNMSMVLDGHTGVEHNLPVAPLYKDVTSVWSKTKAHNTPTLIVNYGGVNGEFYFYQHENIWEKERLLSFMPRGILDSRARHRMMIPEEEYQNGHILTSESCKKLNDAGVNINLGAHGQLQGLGAHWELWMFEQGGMTNYEALKAATINGAIYLGMDKEIGSIETGKLADLIVIDGNPLEDIRVTEQVIYTMVNGRLYDSATMNEIGNRVKNRKPFYFELEGDGQDFPFFEQTNSFMRPSCHCHQ